MGVPVSAAWEYGPLTVVLALAAVIGLKGAIAGAVAATLLDAAWRIRHGRPFTRFYRITTALTLGFGAVSALSMTQGRRLFLLCRRWGWLGRPSEAGTP